MTEERVLITNISVTPERIMPKGSNLRRNSTEKMSTRTSLSSSNTGEKILSRFLSPSTGSCHDFCKQGGRRIFEMKEKQPISSMLVGSKETPVESQNSMNNVKKKPTGKLKVSPEQGSKFSDKPKIVKQNAFSSSKKISVSAKSKIFSKPETMLLNSSSPSNPRGSVSGRRDSNNDLVKNSGSSNIEEKKVLNRPTTSILPKSSVNGSASLKLTKNMNTKAPFHVKNPNKVRKAEPKVDKTTEKTLYVIIEPKLENKSPNPVILETINDEIPLSSPSASLSTPPLSVSPIMSSQKDRENEGSNSAHSDETEKKVQAESSIEDIRIPRSVVIQSEDKETVLGMINPLLTSYHKEQEGSDSRLSKDTEKKKGVEISGKNNRRPRRGSVIHTEDKDSVPQMLKFKRGNVVSLQYEDKGPRRLKFRQGGVIGDNQNSNGGEVGRRSFRKRELGSIGDSNITSPKMQTVVLRHRNMQRKKDAQGLFNHVIEETANKLVKTRKSKVKALVGAFETVISLQGRKPVNAI